VRHHHIAIPVAGALLAGCLDLSLPATQLQDPGPIVSFDTPADGGLIPLTSLVQLEVTSFHGIQDVTLRCNDLTVQQWRGQPPFYATIDFTPCSAAGVLQGTDGGASVPAKLQAQGVDSLGVQGPVAEVDVQLDVSSPAISISAPSRVSPGGALTAVITSDRPLAAYPVVEVQGSPATVVGNPGGLTFTATYDPLPQIGVDAYDAGAPDADIPIDVLEDVERPLLLTVDARGLNGNATHVTFQMLLSRIVWQKPVPGIITSDAGFFAPCSDLPIAAAAPSGLQLPLFARADPLDGFAGICVPGFMSAADGTFTPVADALGDAGSRLIAFDGTGRALWSDGKTASVYEPGSQSLDQSAAVPFDLYGRRLLPLGPGTLCQAQQGTVSPPCFTNLNCLTPSGAVVGSPVATFPFAPALELTSGDIYFAWSRAGVSCAVGTNCACSDDLFVGRLGAMATVPNPFNGVPPSHVFPVDGGFIVDFFSVAGLQQIQSVNAAGVFGTNTWDIASSGGARRLVAAYPDGTLVSAQLLSGTGESIFEGWAPNVSGPVLSSRIPGFLFPGFGNGGYVATQKGLALLVSTDFPPTSAGVVFLDLNLRPRWLYRYPQIPSDLTRMQLVADPTAQRLYLVDVAANAAVALGL
jgi:hypothetical protein